MICLAWQLPVAGTEIMAALDAHLGEALWQLIEELRAAAEGEI